MHTVLYHAASSEWLLFESPRQVIQAQSVEAVLPALRQVDEWVNTHGLYAAGFISYEAAPAFDAALRTHPPDGFPLLWFGIYERPRQLWQLPPAEKYRLSEWQPSISREEYDQAIERIKDHIAAGDTYQVNYTLRLRAAFEGGAWGLFRAMQQAQPTRYAAYIDTGRFAICSASPELFFQLDGDTITCRPMKGTAARGKTPAEDARQADWLYHSEKNRAENVMIVDMIRNDLGRIAETGSVQTTRLFETERYPTLWQMTSTVSATSIAPLSDLFAALFPCASITGAPKVSTTRIIAALESEQRHLYTGSIGLITPQRQVQLSVAIRTAVVDRAHGQVEYGVGSGIVWDSTIADEYEECLMKTRFLTATRPDFSLLESLLWTPDEGYFLLDRHLQRLNASAKYFDYPFDWVQAEKVLQECAATLPTQSHKIRLLLDQDGHISSQAASLTNLPKPDPARVRLAATPVDSQDVFLYHKTTQRQVYDSALAACRGCDEIILWNERGELTETATANLVLELDGRLVTPPVSCGLLAGTFRAELLARGEIHEQIIPVTALEHCQGIFLINSVRRWRQALLLS